MAALAENYVRQGLIDDAEKLMLDATGVGERTEKTSREVPVQTLTYLSYFYLSQRRYEEAEFWAQKALQASLESFGEDREITLLPTLALGMIDYRQGRYEQAEA